MSITGISNSPTPHFTQMAPLSRMAGTFSNFLYSIPTLLVSFLALQSTGLASTLEKPPVRDRYSQLNPFKSQGTTPIWTNQVGQYTLNPEDPRGSYQSYAEAFEEPLTKWLQVMNEIASKSDDIIEQVFEHSLTNSVDRYVPQELQIDGALRNPKKLFDYSEEVNSLNHPTLVKKALEIIRKWHRGYEVSVHTQLITNASLGNEDSNLTFHFDGSNHAGLTLRASEYPLVKNEVWITKNGEKARLKSIDETTGEIEVTILEHLNSVSGKAATLKNNELDYHACVSGKTTQIVPGLISSSSPYTIYDQNVLGQSNSPMQINANHLLKYAVQLPYKSSLLFPGGPLVHSEPSYHNEPNSKALNNCSKIFRKRLVVVYKRSPKTTTYSALEEFTDRLFSFFSKHAGPLINAACVLLLLFVARVFTMPAI